MFLLPRRFPGLTVQIKVEQEDTREASNKGAHQQACDIIEGHALNHFAQAQVEDARD